MRVQTVWTDGMKAPDVWFGSGKKDLSEILLDVEWEPCTHHRKNLIYEFQKLWS
jgi:hypothetical protein